MTLVLSWSCDYTHYQTITIPIKLLCKYLSQGDTAKMCPKHEKLIKLLTHLSMTIIFKNNNSYLFFIFSELSVFLGRVVSPEKNNQKLSILSMNSFQEFKFLNFKFHLKPDNITILELFQTLILSISNS